MVEINTVEVIRSNQKVFDLSGIKYAPSAVAAKGSLVAIGAEVIIGHSLCFYIRNSSLFCYQDSKIHLYQWDGKVLKEDTVLEGNKAVVSALAFSPDGNLLASGDVSSFVVFSASNVIDSSCF